MNLSKHLLCIFGITALLAFCLVYPFLPGRYDALAFGLSAKVQVFGFTGLLLVPLGALWLGFDCRKCARRRRNLNGKEFSFHFALAALLTGFLVVLAVALAGAMSVGFAWGLLTFGAGLYAVVRTIPRLKRLRTTTTAGLHPAPLYLVFLPVAVVILHWTLAGPVTEFSRNRAIAQSAELIAAIERHRAEQGRYPRSLLAVWPDYTPSVVGIERYHYAPQGEAYNLAFEQPRLLFDDFGVREFVMYNPRDEQIMPSHASWVLIWSPEELARQQGWFAVHDAAQPHWKRFWFD